MTTSTSTPMSNTTYEAVRDEEMSLYPSSFFDETDFLHAVFFAERGTRRWTAGALIRRVPVDPVAYRAQLKANYAQMVAEYTAQFGADHRSAYVHNVTRLISIVDDWPMFEAACRTEEQERRQQDTAREFDGFRQHAKGWSRPLFVSARSTILQIPAFVDPSWYAAARRALEAVHDGRLRCRGPRARMLALVAHGLVAGIARPRGVAA